MMTTMAALMGTLPIALSMGAGAESRRPLGIAVVGGLAFSQLITLYVTPVVYTYMDGVSSRFDRWMASTSEPKHGAADLRPEHAIAVTREGARPLPEPRIAPVHAQQSGD
jgi:hypothetical protein